jgi:hypothetical protein
MNVFFCLCISAVLLVATGFIPHPAVRLGGQAGESEFYILQ